MVFRLGGACRGSVREEEVHEVLGEDVDSWSGVRVRMVHRLLVVDADKNDVACGNGLDVDLVVGGHHTKGFLNSQVKARRMRRVTCPLRARRRLGIELPASASPSSTS
jgi:hypothetical protein